MALPAIVFNSGAGSDTAASGAGPSTAVAGTGAAHTGGVSSTTITLTNSPDLSGVLTDGSAVIWIDTPSGRQFSKITAADDGADTVTTEDAFNIASGSACNYAIGGKRATWDHADSRTVFADAKPGWTIKIEDNQSLASGSRIEVTASGSATGGRIVICGASASSRSVITQTGNAAVFNINSSSFLLFRDLTLANSNGTKTSAEGFRFPSNTNVVIQNCVLGDQTNSLRNGLRSVSGSPLPFVEDCEIKYCTDAGISFASQLDVLGCWIHDNASDGIAFSGVTRVRKSRITGNGGDGLRATAFSGQLKASDNTIHGNTGDGIDLSTNAACSTYLEIVNNQITGNGNYGIRGHADTDGHKWLVDYNNYGSGGTANTSGATLSVTAGPNSLNVDPGYTNAGSNDFSVGTTTQAKGYPGAGGTSGGAGQTGTTSYVDIGAAQRQESGGSGVVRRVGGVLAR